MNDMTSKPYPVWIDTEEADDLCIQKGWYISDDKSIATNRYTGNPFGSETEALQYIENISAADVPSD